MTPPPKLFYERWPSWLVVGAFFGWAFGPFFVRRLILFSHS